MKRFLIVPGFCLSMASALLMGCASDSMEPESIPEVNPDFSFSFKVKADAPTRAQDPGAWDSKFSSMVGYITEKGKGDIVNVALATNFPSTWTESIDDVDVEYIGDGEYEVVMSTVASLDKGKEYDLYVAANITGADLTRIFNARFTASSSELSSLRISTPNSSWLNVDAATVESTKSMPMTCNAPISFKIETSDETEYSRENPFMIGGDKSNPGREKFTMTRALARVDFKDASENADYTYQIENSASQLKVKFAGVRPINLASSAYMKLTYAAPVADKIVTIPAVSTSNPLFPANKFNLPESASSFATLCYLPENVQPAASLTISNATGLRFIGVLLPDEKCDATVKKYLQGELLDSKHPRLYYFDDGIYQSPLVYLESAPSPSTDWFYVDWNAEYNGYTVEYLHTVRHGGVNGQKEGDAATTSPEDGVVSPMEYGVVRNFIYEMSIAKVSSLPHRKNPDDNPESKPQISVNINVTPWNYHRGGFEVGYK